MLDLELEQTVLTFVLQLFVLLLFVLVNIIAVINPEEHKDNYGDDEDVQSFFALFEARSSNIGRNIARVAAHQSLRWHFFP